MSRVAKTIVSLIIFVVFLNIVLVQNAYASSVTDALVTAGNTWSQVKTFVANKVSSISLPALPQVLSQPISAANIAIPAVTLPDLSAPAKTTVASVGSAWSALTNYVGDALINAGIVKMPDAPIITTNTTTTTNSTIAQTTPSTIAVVPSSTNTTKIVNHYVTVPSASVTNGVSQNQFNTSIADLQKQISTLAISGSGSFDTTNLQNQINALQTGLMYADRPFQYITVGNNSIGTGNGTFGSLTSDNATLATANIGTLSVSGTATSTFGGGVNIASGCFSVNGTCLGAGTGNVASINGLSDAIQTFATTSDANIGLSITSAGGVHTFTPTWTGSLAIARGGTGTTTIPTVGQLLIGNGNGGYSLVATSSLGFGGSQWTTSGSNLYYDTGSVGIGNTSPQAKLDVTGQTLIGNGDRTAQSTFPLYISDSSSLGWKVADANGNSKFELYAGFNGTSEMRLLNGEKIIGYSQDLTLGTDLNGSSITIKDNVNGYVGIGTTTPLYNLDIAPSGTTAIERLTPNTWSTNSFAQLIMGDTNHYIKTTYGVGTQIQDQNGTFLTGGNVGIGSTTPLSRLSVTGSGTTNPFTIASSSGSSMFTVLANGNVGIGLASPNTLLSVYGGVSKFETGPSYGGGDGIATFAANFSAGSLDLKNAASTNDFTIVQQAVNSWNLGTLNNYNVNLIASSTNVMTLLTSGNVGIGTTTPTAKLTIDSTGASSTISQIIKEGIGQTVDALDIQNSSGLALFRVDANGNAVARRVYSSTDATNYIDLSLTGQMAFQTNGSERLRIDSSGNVGIGTTSPSSTLSVSGSGTTNPFTIASSSGSTLFTVLANGNVGIGTTSPYALLSIDRSTSSTTAFVVKGTAGKGYDLQRWEYGTGNAPVLRVDEYGNLILNADPNGIPIGNYIKSIDVKSAAISTRLDLENNAGAGNTGTAIAFVNGTTVAYTSAQIQTSSIGTNGNSKFSFMIRDASANLNEKFTIMPTGEVGIGTTTPAATLSVMGTSTTNPFIIASSSGSSLFTVDTSGNLVSAGTLTVSGTATSTLLGPLSLLNGLKLVSSGSNVQFSTVINDMNGSQQMTSFGSGASAQSFGAAFGMNAIAQNGIAIGPGANASPNNIAIGRSVVSTNGQAGVFIGTNLTIGSSFSSIGIGDGVSVTGNYAIGMGKLAYANGLESIAIGHNATSSAAGAVAIGPNINNSTANSLMIGPSDVAKLTILSSGNVGIGTTTPGTKLEIQSASDSADVLHIRTGNTFIYEGANATSNYGTIGSYNTATGGNALLLLQQAGGNVSIATTNNNSRLDVNGDITDESLKSCDSSTQAVGTDSNGKFVCDSSLSDQRLKGDITSLDASTSLAAILNLNPVSFYWKDPTIPGTGLTSQQFGFIAQQVAGTFPNLVGTTSTTSLTSDVTYTLNYQGFFAPLVASVQAIYHQVSSLAATVASFATSFTSQNVNTQNLCVSDSSGAKTCITKAQLDALIQNSGQHAAQPSQTQNQTPTSQDNTQATIISTSTDITTSTSTPDQTVAASSSSQVSDTSQDSTNATTTP